MSFPLWFIWAIIGHLANGTAFVIDKSLLRGSFKHPGTYASLIGFLGLLAVVLLPFGVHWPSAAGWFWIVLAGMTFIVSLWAFFAALAAGEASRVVPVVGSLTPILTLAGTSLLLGERLSTQQLLGFGLLIVATVILSGGARSSRLTKRTLGMAILAAATGALALVAAKASYETAGFMTALALSRFTGLLTAILILFLDKGTAAELRGAIFPKANGSKTKGPAFTLVLTAQLLGGLGFVGVQYAASLGSASLVGALQAVQYALLVLVAFALRKKAPALLGEDLTPATIARKLAAIAIVGLGLWFVV